MKKIISFSIKFLITIALLAYIFNKIPLLEVIDAITSANLIFIAAGLLLIPPSFFVEAHKLKILTDEQKMSASVSKIFEITMIATFYSIFLPGYLASGAVRWYKLSRPNKKHAEALAAIAYNRLFDSINIILLGIFFLLAAKPPNSSSLVGISLIIILIALLAIHFLAFNKHISSYIVKNIDHMTFFPQTIRRKISKFLNSTGKYHSLKKKPLIKMLVFSHTRNILDILAFYLFAVSLNLNISMLDLGWIRTFVYIITLLPISISGLGVREGTLIYMLGAYEISPLNAVAFSLILFGRNLIAGGLGGLFEAKNLLRSS
jgi:uncharacterized protein (TIRG00374 family)